MRRDYNMKNIAQTQSKQHLNGLAGAYPYSLPEQRLETDNEFKRKRPKQHRALYRAICSYKSECNLYMRKGLLVLHWLPQLLSCRYRDSNLFSEKIRVLPLCKSSVRPYGNDNISMTPYLPTGTCYLVSRFCIHSNNTCSFRVCLCVRPLPGG